MQELAISGPATSATTPQSFGFDDLFGLGLSTAPAPTPSPPLLKLNARAALDPGAFQQKWRQLPISLTQVFFPQLLVKVFYLRCYFFSFQVHYSLMKDDSLTGFSSSFVKMLNLARGFLTLVHDRNP